MPEVKKIGIITSGGDCGGLNAVIKGAARTAIYQGINVVIIPNGYAGLYNLADIELVELDAARLEKIDSKTAGSEAGHSRVKIGKIKDPDKYEKIRAGLKKHSIDALVIAGGDDTGSVTVDLGNNGIPCVHVPKTMDLDLQTYSVGGDSTINKIAQYTQELRTTGLTHNRALVVEVFARYAGHTAFRGGIAADADCILIPEIPVDYDIVYKHFKETYMRRLEHSDVKGSTYTIVVAEGVTDLQGSFVNDDVHNSDSFGHKKLSGIGKYVRMQLERIMYQDPEWKDFLKHHGVFVPDIYEFPEIREISLGHLVRSGQTSSYDVAFGKQAGAAAVLLVKQGIFGVTVVGIEGSRISYLPSEEAIKQRHVDLNDIALYESMGVCFGRENELFVPEYYKHEGLVHRYF